MHELSLAGGILQLVDQALVGEGPVRVKRLVLDVGMLAGVEIASLRFALEALAPGTALAGAELRIEQTPGGAWCMQCAQSVPIRHRLDDCPRCGGRQLTPNSGTELMVRELVVDDGPLVDEPAITLSTA
jgi:hydrogenase nickel incorporation protein HypA/HybF